MCLSENDVLLTIFDQNNFYFWQFLQLWFLKYFWCLLIVVRSVNNFSQRIVDLCLPLKSPFLLFHQKIELLNWLYPQLHSASSCISKSYYWKIDISLKCQEYPIHCRRLAWGAKNWRSFGQKIDRSSILTTFQDTPAPNNGLFCWILPKK